MREEKMVIPLVLSLSWQYFNIIRYKYLVHTKNNQNRTRLAITGSSRQRSTLSCGPLEYHHIGEWLNGQADGHGMGIRRMTKRFQSKESLLRCGWVCDHEGNAAIKCLHAGWISEVYLFLYAAAPLCRGTTTQNRAQLWIIWICVSIASNRIPPQCNWTHPRRNYR